MENHYYDNTHPLNPYTHSTPANVGTIKPINALRGDKPIFQKGYWPCVKNNKWIQIEDHRKLDNNVLFNEEVHQDGTEYWLPEDKYLAEPRIMKDIGPLPDNAILTAPIQSFESLYEEKYKEIINKANMINNLLSIKFSTLEEKTWPEQEAGARFILNDIINVKNNVSRLILSNEKSSAEAVSLVKNLAIADSTTPEEFSIRICTNADQAYNAGLQTLFEQRHMEHKLKEMKTLEELQEFKINYSLLNNTD